MKKLFALVMAAVMTMSLAACGAKEEAPSAPAASAPAASAPAEGTAFRLGGTGPLTGGAAIYGNAVKYGAEIAVEEINAMGGIQFDLKMEDDTHDAEKAVNAYNALKEVGGLVFTGPTGTNVNDVAVALLRADQ